MNDDRNVARSARAASLLAQVNSSYDEGQWRECVAACQRAIDFGVDERIDDWYLVRATLAAAAVKLEGEEGFSEAVEMAIRSMREVVESEQFDRLDERRGLSYRSLGYLYTKRDEAGGNGDYELSVQSYREAVSILRPESSAREWAEAMLGLGTQLMSRTRRLAHEEIARDGEEMARARKSVGDAINAFQEALEIYTEAAFPEERQETAKLIDRAHRLLEILNREERRLQ